MLRRLLDNQLTFFKNSRYLKAFVPLVAATDTFLFEAPINTKRGPHIRDAVDLKRWMFLVVLALMPCILMALWNTGLQKFIYSSADFHLMDEYLASSSTFQSYFSFVIKDNRFLTILQYGLAAFLPVMLISYAVGGIIEAMFAYARGHEIAEGFLVTGMLYPLILPSTIPYWMVAVGVASGVIISKELFGGTGMNILNPALTCRCILFFSFPNKMSGDVWAGTNPSQTISSLITMNQAAGRGELDGYTQSSPLTFLNCADEIKRIHVDAIASNDLGSSLSTFEVLQSYFQKWSAFANEKAQLGALTLSQMKAFVIGTPEHGGLGLAPDHFKAAVDLSGLTYGLNHFHDGNLFFGNHVGCMGETSTLACLLGAAFLILLGIGSWRTMLACTLGALGTAFCFQWGAQVFGIEGGAWNPAKFAVPAYKHLLMGGLAFGFVFMATDPVSSPSRNLSRWIYGLLIGFLTVVIRIINPAYPEGVMLSILFGNVCAPLIDHLVLINYRRKVRVRTTS